MWSRRKFTLKGPGEASPLPIVILKSLWMGQELVSDGCGMPRVEGPASGLVETCSLSHLPAMPASSFPTSSDARLKRDIRPLTHALDKLDKIRGISFAWNELYESLGCSTGHRKIGVIAQEVEAVFPELVTRWGKEGYRAVDYGRLTAVLIEAVKKLNARQKSQQQSIVELEGRLAAIEQGKSGNSSPLQLSSWPTVWCGSPP
jgi:hypothetical protein